MNIAPFQDMPADDVEAFQDFQLSHNMAHQKIYDTLLSQGKVKEEGLGRLACLMSFLFVFSAFFRG